MKLAGITVASAALGSIRLGRSSVWLDEAISVREAQAPLRAELGSLLRGPVDQNLYYVQLHLWKHIAGTSEVAIRLPSVLAVAATVAVVGLIGRRLGGDRVGLVAALFLGANGFVLYYAQEARTYALLMLAVAITSLLFLRAAEAPSVVPVSLYAVAGAVSLYLHPVAALVLLAHVATALAWPGIRRQLMLGYVAMGALVIPLGLALAAHGTTDVSWIPAPSWSYVEQTAWTLVGFVGLLVLIDAALVAVVATFVVRRFIERRRREALPAIFALLWLSVPIAGSIVVSLAGKPVLLSRYLIVILPSLALVASIGVCKLGGRRIVTGAVVVVMAISVVGLSRVSHYRKDDWRSASRYLLARSTRADGIIFYGPYTNPPFQYYAQRLGRPNAPRPIYPSSVNDAPPVAALGSTGIDHLVAGYQRIWLVENEDWTPDRLAGRSLLIQTLSREGRLIDEQSFLRVRVELWLRS
jgi:mannosyltransferase